MNRRLVGVVLVLVGLLLACFSRLAADPSSLIVDADRPSLDHARPTDDHSAGNDLTRLFLPHHLAISRSLKRFGHVPQWDDRGFGGRPLLGNPQAGLFYPPTWIAWMTGAPAALGWLTIGHLLWSGLGAYRLSRTLGTGEWGSLVAACCVQLSPYVLGQTFEGHYPHVWAACWYPWAIDAAVRLRRGDRAAGLWLVPILVATFLTGHPQEGYYLTIALGIWGGFDLLKRLRLGRSREAIRVGADGVGIMVLVLGLLGVEIIPDLLAQGWTLKGARLTLRLAGRYHDYPVNVLQILGPRALGGPSDYFGHENYWESVLSIGLIPFALTMIGVAYSTDRRSVRGWLILVGSTVLFAFGRRFGLFAILYEVVPGMDRFRVPGRSLFLASLGMSMLAGLGVEALRGRVLEWRRLFRVGLLGSICVGGFVFGGWILSGNHEDRLTPPVQATEVDRLLGGLARLSTDPAFWVALGIIPVALGWGWKRPGSRPRVAVALGLLGLLELLHHGHLLIQTTPAARFLGADPIGEAIRKASPPTLGPPRIRAVDSLFDDLRAGQAGLSKTNVNDSFQVEHAADLYRPLYHLFDADRFNHGDSMDEAAAAHHRDNRQVILDRMAVSFLVEDRLNLAAPWPRIASGQWNGSTYTVYRNPTALPRAYVVPRAEVIDDRASIVDRFREFDPHQSVLMFADPLGANLADREPFQAAEWASDVPDRLVLRVTTRASGLLVVADTWMPGWSAEVDGESAPVLRGNHAQRVIPLPKPGQHVIVLRYQTPGFYAGLALTFASLLIWLLLAGHSRRTSTNPTYQPEFLL